MGLRKYGYDQLVTLVEDTGFESRKVHQIDVPWCSWKHAPVVGEDWFESKVQRVDRKVSSN